MIQPTTARVVHYFRDRDSEAQAAIIAHVNQDGTVNLAVFDHNGTPEPRAAGIRLVQDGEPLPLQGHYCSWMPYQIGQAAKTEAVLAQFQPVGSIGMGIGHTGSNGGVLSGSVRASRVNDGTISFYNENTGFGGVFSSSSSNGAPAQADLQEPAAGAVLSDSGSTIGWIGSAPPQMDSDFPVLNQVIEPAPAVAPAADVGSLDSSSSSSSDSSSSSSSDSSSSSSSDSSSSSSSDSSY